MLAWLVPRSCVLLIIAGCLTKLTTQPYANPEPMTVAQLSADVGPAKGLLDTS
jgi:hypothetical protein